MLWMAAEAKGYSAPIWMTYKQAAELGGQVRKGSRGSLVVYADTFTRREADEDGREQEVAVPFLRNYTVFNANDSGFGSLRQTITDANTDPGANTITFDPAFFNTPRTISLLTALPQPPAAGGNRPGTPPAVPSARSATTWPPNTPSASRPCSSTAATITAA